MINRRDLLAVAGVGLASTVLGAPAIAKAGTSSILVGQPSSGFIYLPIYVARKLGYFENEGISPEFVVFEKGGSEALAALIAGQSQIYIGNPGLQLRAQEKGQAIKSFAAVQTQFGSDLVISAEAAAAVRLDSLKTPQEKAAALRGLKIAVAGPGSLTDLMVKHIARFGGLEPDRDVTIVPIGGGSSMLAAFGQKRIDGYALSAPTSTIGIQELGGRLLFDFAKAEYPPFADFTFYTLIARQDWLSENGDDARKFVRGLWRGLRLMKEQPDTARDAVQSFFPKVDKRIFDLAWRQALPAFAADPTIQEAGMKKNFDFLEAGDGHSISLPIDASYTNEFVEAVARSMN
ncbi:ABC transporter substrate-binding protein [Agrobacterium vitis]|uniref:ABC transporter substrate-binding protein n=1 Tax=Agrobacterium vitis TaxID=373 RepID=UPI000871EB6A|nr:ABC transporter substrate-binding protein [Agrobacterium vitis]MCE6076843.1 ABC transporter substrate-binding protein [Agrobacterium vitis]MCM2450076.1 ABC transporter substrate-binding protein [Agrobacterium vitis]MCM2470823.1 ABC transporter substrate-binding protein [Agrobacterium vitis]MUO71227.1 ABC transporter substrate-binding protein [Agrobacterium vitis]MUO84309.1 ABC transporter substrate-binding protein [Agrobacterium vitis]